MERKKNILFVYILDSQLKPEYPGGQSHLYPYPVETQFPPFWHGFELHGDMDSHLDPEYPGKQIHVTPP